MKKSNFLKKALLSLVIAASWAMPQSVFGYDYNFHAFLWQNGTMTDLGTLGGRESYANAINNSGQVVGNANTASGSTRAFLYSGGAMQNLGTLPGTNMNSVARGINDSGQVAGDSQGGTNNYSRAFLYSGGAMQNLGTLPGGISSQGRGINDSGQVVGDSYSRP